MTFTDSLFQQIHALTTEGIQHGHMTLHTRQGAITAGTSGDMSEKVAAQMVAEMVIRIGRAEKVLRGI